MFYDFNCLCASEDYRFLEETKRVAESARRMISGFRCYFGFKLPTKLLMLRNAARRRQIQLLFLPAGMSKRETNQSRYDQRKNTIFWTLELRFHDTGVVLAHHGMVLLCADCKIEILGGHACVFFQNHEHANLLSIFLKHLTPGPWNHKLRSFCEAQLDDLKLFIQINPKNSKSIFRKLDIKAPIGSQLAKIVVLEHPIIFVYLPSHENGFEVEASRMPLLRNTPPSTFDGIPSHNGTLYRVEEVEEGDMPSDTRITDLVDCRKSVANCNVPSNTFIAKEIAKTDNAVPFTDKQITVATTGVFKHQLSGEAQGELATNSPESGDAVFYFEKELRDAYSDLIGEMNPDDFLCLDSVYEDSVDLREARWYDIEERGRGDAEEIRDAELDELRDAFEIRKGDGLAEKEENDDLKEKLVADFGNELKVRRDGDLEEKREDSFLSGGIPFGEMELEEGEIPCFS
ncbi:hypothetical protein IEQ34_018212 [Dendrobium chrysotoxum]|uniref:BCD1 alpha/beta domain-containing protein n=1 Tax=Dendrobium chrysotoxum TaxID=161865 RepID=A0AAV7GES1_DENCH|nr:hypothetical protein IEQ34_018212 [Dendrobium chrysotoxum]